MSRPNVGDRAPDFTLPDGSGAPVRLSELLSRKVVVLYFYPKDETPGCTAESCAFRDAYDDFNRAGAEVVGVSRDDGASHRRFAAHHKLPFVLLSDPEGRVHEVYGIRSRWGFLRDRVTFVIDRAGIVRHVFTSMIDMQGHVKKALPIVRELANAP
jgi:thioredoxin-dependent peroxiredoxin